MSRASSSAPADRRVIVLLQDLVNEVRTLRSICESGVELLRAQSNVATAVSNNIPAERDTLMTAAELARYLRIDSRTLRQMRHSGAVPESISIGPRSPRWRRGDVEAFLSKGDRK